MAVGTRVLLRRNIGTEDGLVIGVMGTVVGFEWPEGVAVDDPERQPTAIKVLFDNKRVGQKAQQYAMERDGIVKGDVPHSPVFITPATSKFLDRTKTPSGEIPVPIGAGMGHDNTPGSRTED
jgi:hypothetical protein